MTFWNLAILGLALIGFGFGMLFINQSRVAGEIDRELYERVTRGGRGPGGGRGGPGGPGGPIGQEGLGGPGPGGQGEGRNFGRGQGQFGRQMEPPRGLDQEGFRIANLRRPRLFNESLEPLSQPEDIPFDSGAARRAVETGRTFYTNATFDGERIRVVSHPVQGPGGGRLVFQAARETRELETLWRSQLLTLAVFLPLALLAAGLAAMFLTSRAMKPIGDMRDAASRISETNLSERLEVQGEDEFAELGETFNAMVGRLENSFTELREAYEQQRRFTADASHELRTPLTRLNLATSAALQPGSATEEMERALKIAHETGDEMARLVSQLLLLAKADAGQLGFHREKVDLRVLASEAIEFLPKPAGIEVETRFPDRAAYAEVDSDAIRRVLINLLENAFRHCPAGKVTVSILDGPVVEVADTGEGIAREHIPHLTERFYRVDASRTGATGGSGLGLAICRTILEGHGGKLEIESELGIGTKVRAIF